MTTPTSGSLLPVTEEEDRRFLDLVRSLSDEEWRAPTDCPGWDVRTMVLHVLGAVESYRMRESAHQMLAGRKRAGDRDLVDGVNDVQIEDRSDLTDEEIITHLAIAAPKFRRARARLPWPVTTIRVPAPGGKVSLGRLMSTIYTRDTWMHRVDIHRAVGRPMPLDDHDRMIVANIVGEWARRHGQPYDLVLTGPAGGEYRDGIDGEHIELDAIAFCRFVSGRESGSGLLETPVTF